MPLGASTLNRKWRVEIDSSANLASAYSAARPFIVLLGRTEGKLNRDPSMQDDSDFDGGGFGSDTKTAEKWSYELKVKRATVLGAPTTYDPAQEILRLKGSGQFGDANSVQVRIAEVTPNGPTAEAYWGTCAVEWGQEGGGYDALDMASVKLNGQGQLVSITHPGAASAPVITGFTPASTAVAGGASVQIRGAGFSTATGLTVDAVAVTALNWQIISDTLIVMTAPAKAAGARPVIVTNPTGASAPVSLTYV